MKAYSHVRAVVAGGRMEAPDLYDLLSYTRAQETYQNYIGGVGACTGWVRCF